MSKGWVITVLLGVALAGWNTAEAQTSPPTGPTCFPEELELPPAPTIQVIPDTGVVPSIPPTSQIVVVIYPRGRRYAAAGVDTIGRRFNFYFTGGTPTLAAALDRFYATQIPVTVYTAPLDLVATTKTSPRTSLVPPIGPRPMEPRESFDGGSGPDGGLDGGEGGDGGTKCTDCRPDISDDPPPAGDTPGGDDWLLNFLRLAWRAALHQSTVATPHIKASIHSAP